MTISKAFLSGKLINDGAPSAIEFLDDGVHVADSAISIDFVGDSVQATTDGAGNVSVNISNNAVDLSWVAPLDSPALTGIPTAPTAVAGTNTTQLANTAFVATAVSSVALPSQTGNSGKFLSTDGSTASWATSGTLPVGNGGTGVTTLTGLVKANGASAFTAAVAGVDYMSPSAELDGGTF